MSEQFDDIKLINLARFNFFSTKSNNKNIEKLLSREKLNNDERNEILTFLEESRFARPMRIRDMKEFVFKTIGYKGESNSYNSTVSRSEMEAIFNYFKELRKS